MGGVAIVTGGGSGIGRALAHELAVRGGHVVVADLDAAAAAAVVDEIAAGGSGSAEARAVDVADAEAVTTLVRGTHDEHGRLDVLCNNAGVGLSVPARDLTLDQWQRTLDVNLRGLVHGCTAAVPLMLAQGGGRILNTASLAGLIGGLGSGAPYAASKFGAVGLSLALHTGLAHTGIVVTVLCPGGVDTPLLDRREFVGLTAPEGVEVMTMREVMAMARTPLVSAERVARDALDGLARGKPLVVTPASARFAWRFYRLAPGAMLRVSRRVEAWLAGRETSSGQGR